MVTFYVKSLFEKSLGSLSKDYGMNVKNNFWSSLKKLKNIAKSNQNTLRLRPGLKEMFVNN